MSERKHRAGQLRSLSHHRMQIEALKQVGTVKQVLMLKEFRQNTNSTSAGLSRDFWNLKIEDSDHRAEEVWVEVKGLDPATLAVGDSGLIGQLVQRPQEFSI